jgi:hypothetical protein
MADAKAKTLNRLSQPFVIKNAFWFGMLGQVRLYPLAMLTA